MNHIPETELVTIDEMAARLAMSRKTFTRLVRVHRVPKVRIGHKIVRYSPVEVIAFFTSTFTSNPVTTNP